MEDFNPFEDLDDNTLRYELESRGQSIGPIVDSTRNLYQKLLKRLMDEEINALIGDQNNEEEEEEESLLSTTSSAQTTRNSVDGSPHESQQKTKSKSIYVFVLSLILCIIFAYYVKKG